MLHFCPLSGSEQGWWLNPKKRKIDQYNMTMASQNGKQSFTLIAVDLRPPSMIQDKLDSTHHHKDLQQLTLILEDDSMNYTFSNSRGIALSMCADSSFPSASYRRCFLPIEAIGRWTLEPLLMLLLWLDRRENAPKWDVLPLSPLIHKGICDLLNDSTMPTPHPK
jgi:hypothetical protein